MFRTISFSAVLMLTVSSICTSAKADLIVTFDEIAGDVIASTSGSIEVPSPVELNFSGTFLVGFPNQLSWLAGNINRFDGGTNGGFSLNTVPTTGSGSSFGIENQFIYFDASAPTGSLQSPLTTWTWNSTDLATIGLGSLTQTPAVVYTASNGETVSFATTAVPEPSSFVLIGIAGFALLSRRRSRYLIAK